VCPFAARGEIPRVASAYELGKSLLTPGVLDFVSGMDQACSKVLCVFGTLCVGLIRGIRIKGPRSHELSMPLSAERC